LNAGRHYDWLGFVESVGNSGLAFGKKFFGKVAGDVFPIHMAKLLSQQLVVRFSPCPTSLYL
jgi:hypothetical protein